MATVVLVGTLDTKGAEYAFVRERLREAGLAVTLVDCGVLGEPQVAPDVPREDVARSADANLAALVAAGDRGAAVQAMTHGAEAVVRKLHAEGKLQGAMALGGGGGTAIAAQAFQALPLGVPKLIVTTMASGDTRLCRRATWRSFPASSTSPASAALSARVLSNAAAAMAGMIGAPPVPDTGCRS